MLIANSRKITIAIAKPIVSTGNPLDLSSNHTCALVADEVGHGNRNRDDQPVRVSARSLRPGHDRDGIAAALPRYAGDRETERHDANQDHHCVLGERELDLQRRPHTLLEQKEQRRIDHQRSDPLDDSVSGRPLDAGISKV